MFPRLKTTLAVAALAVTTIAAAQAPAGKPERIRGEIVAVNGDSISIKRRTGDTVIVDAKPDVPVSAVKKIALADIKPGSFIGTAARTEKNGKLTALEVLVFPEAARGTGEGHYAWDLLPNSTMTNANVDSVLQATDGRDLKLSYKGGTQTVTVPAEAPVVTFTDATRADVVAGKRVFAVALPVSKGHYTGQRLVVEKDGVVPPM